MKMYLLAETLLISVLSSLLPANLLAFAYKLAETDTHLPRGKGPLGNIQTHVHCLSLNVTRVSPAVSDRSIYYPVYVKPASVSWHGISVPWNIDGHHSLSIAFIPFCPFCSCGICFVVYLGKAICSKKSTAENLQVDVPLIFSLLFFDPCFLPAIENRCLMTLKAAKVVTISNQIYVYNAFPL